MNNDPLAVIQVAVRLFVECNDSSHWRIKYQRHKKHSLLIKSEFRKLPSIPLPVRIKMIRQGKRQVDSDNLMSSFKHIRDSISDLLLKEDRYYLRKTKSGVKKVKISGKNDSDDRITWEYHQEITKNFGMRIEFHLP